MNTQIASLAEIIEVSQLGALVDLDVTGLAAVAKYDRAFHSIAVRFRASLAKHSFMLRSMRPFRWVPYTAYASWQIEYIDLRDELERRKRQFIEQHPAHADLCDDIAVDYHTPTLLITPGAMVESNDELSEMHEREYQHALFQMECAWSPFEDVFRQLRCFARTEAQEILAVIKRRGHLPGTTAEKARALIETCHRLNAHGDDELVGRLAELSKILDAKTATIPYDLEALKAVLQGLTKLPSRRSA